MRPSSEETLHLVEFRNQDHDGTSVFPSRIGFVSPQVVPRVSGRVVVSLLTNVSLVELRPRVWSRAVPSDRLALLLGHVWCPPFCTPALRGSPGWCVGTREAGLRDSFCTCVVCVFFVFRSGNLRQILSSVTTSGSLLLLLLTALSLAKKGVQHRQQMFDSLIPVHPVLFHFSFHTNHAPCSVGSLF